MSFRRSKSIVACGQSHREADGAVWGFAIERYTFKNNCLFSFFNPLLAMNTLTMPATKVLNNYLFFLLYIE